MKLSIIVPVYNVEKYLNRCINSLLNQNLDYPYEIILVDDGSTDSSGEICDNYKFRFKNVNVIHQVNQGLGPARNSGLMVAKGKYVTFVDSDDWVERDTYKKFIDMMEKTKCSVATCGRKIVDDNGIREYIYCLTQSKILYGDEIIEHYLLQNDMNMSACDKVFEKSLFADVLFPANYVSEDIVPIYKILKKVDKIVLLGEPLYNYYVRLGSLSRTYNFSNKRMGQFIYAKIVSEDVSRQYEKLNEQANYYLYDAFISTWRIIIKSKYLGTEKKELKSFFKLNKKKMFKNKFLSWKQKLYLCFISLKLDSFLEFIMR